MGTRSPSVGSSLLPAAALSSLATMVNVLIWRKGTSGKSIKLYLAKSDIYKCNNKRFLGDLIRGHESTYAVPATVAYAS